MPTDIVFPNKNEKDFVEMAERLGYSKLFLVYARKQDLRPVKLQSRVELKMGIITEAKQVAGARSWSEFVIVRSSGDDRAVIEKHKPGLIFGLEQNPRKDSMHYRSSGLNHVLCALLRKNKISVGFSFQMLLNSKRRAQLLGRITQNIKLCRKYGVRMVLASFAQEPYDMRSPHDLVALGLTMGMHPKEARAAVGL